MSQAMALTAGSHAAQVCEPRQVRKEATVSDVQRVPWECLARATTDDMPPGCCQREVLGHFPPYFACQRDGVTHDFD